jgi:putative N6-adenine-specific DNA methylase
MWTFLNYPWFTKDDHLKENFEKYVTDISERAEKGITFLKKGWITANDVSDYSLGAARENIKKAKLENVIQISNKDALELSPPPYKSLFICNPPYGERLEHDQEEKLKALYKGLGDHWKQAFKGHRAALFTGNLAMLKVVGLRSEKRHILHNGDIECRLAEYSLY